MRIPKSSEDRLTIGQRLIVIAVVSAVAISAAWLLAVNTGGGGRAALSGSEPAGEHTPSGEGPREEDGRPAPTVPADAVPRIDDPVRFAEAFTHVLWSYDAAATSHDERVTQLRAWVTGEQKYADVASVVSQVPSRAAWSGLAGIGQRASAEVDGGRFPASFTRALQDDPGLITEAYVYVVTVTGRQTLTWDSGRGEERRAVSVAVQCRPGQPCAVAGCLPEVAP
ncbi:hypothetical protein ACTWP5_30190 [Streptomyces sp. 4N509B]|uniref:hypothetical protein n=1 Tax=Streptomyces sp. 4N509B TaxID=3457413 RepID=UPI003FD4AAA7